MCKQAEIDALTRFIESLPRQSYLRPWLEDMLPQVREDIRNDLPVSPSLTQARRDRDRLLDTVRQDCEEIRQRAKQDAEQIVQRADATADGIRRRLYHDLRAFAVTLGFSQS